jgi:hypothetical protein
MAWDVPRMDNQKMVYETTLFIWSIQTTLVMGTLCTYRLDDF